MCGGEAFLRCSYWYPGFILSISPSSGVKERNDYTEKELSQLFFKRRLHPRVTAELGFFSPTPTRGPALDASARLCFGTQWGCVWSSRGREREQGYWKQGV